MMSTQAAPSTRVVLENGNMRFLLIDGLFRVPPMLPAECVIVASHYVAADDDIIICSYSGCGSSWIVQVVYLLLNSAHLGKITETMTREVCFLEGEGDAVKNYKAPRIIKTHLPFNREIFNPKAKYIYIARNIKDCCVSLYHIMRTFKEEYGFTKASFDDFFEAFIQGNVEYNDYFDHIMPWWTARNADNVLFLVYETMKKEPKDHVLAIAKFLGGMPAKFVEEQSKLQSVLRMSNILFMRLKAKEYLAATPARKCFVRDGVIGQWKNFLTGEQSRRLDTKFFERTVDTPLNLLWKGMGVFD